MTEYIYIALSDLVYYIQKRRSVNTSRLFMDGSITGIGINKIRDSGLTKDNTEKGSHLGFRRHTPATTQNQVYSPVLVDKSN